MAQDFPRFGQIAGQLVANGYRPLPIPLRQKSPGIEGWPDFVYHDTDHGYDSWGTGILCGATVGLDIDVRVPELATQMRRYAEENLGLAPARIGQAPKVLLVYQVLGDPFTKLQTASYRLTTDQPDDDAHKVEVLAKGQQFVGWNIHQKTKRPYVWNGHGDLIDTPASRLSEVTREQLVDYIQWADGILCAAGRPLSAQARTVLDSKPHIPRGSQRADDVDKFRSALACVPNDADYDAWVLMAYAIKGSLGDAGHSDWMDWSAKSAKHQDKIAEKTWRGVKDPKSGAGTVFYLARLAGWKAPARQNVPRETPPKSVKSHSQPNDNASTSEPTRIPRQSGATHVDTGSAYVSLQDLGLQCNAGRVPYPTIGNVVRILECHPDVAGKIWLDEFRRRIYHRLRGKEEPWTDADALRLTAWFNQSLQLSKFGLQTIHHGVELHAANHSRNSVTHWLESLNWDKTPRLSDWLADCFGILKTDFTMAVARNWLISMVARAYQPGCQADHMPVLEGLSGAGKSSAISILGGEWYRAAPQAFGSKEFFEVIQGAWLVEIPDMVGFGKREHAQIISAITTRSDAFRASYGRNAEDHHRSTIFAATSETDEYLQDSRGKRRYWPLECREIHLDVLRANRDQLFAEAVHQFKSGATWHEVPAEEAAQEQNRREETDPWMSRIQNYIGTRVVITTAEVASDGLFLEVAKQDRQHQMRISKCLKALGFMCKVETVDGRSQRIYRR